MSWAHNRICDQRPVMAPSEHKIFTIRHCPTEHEPKNNTWQEGREKVQIFTPISYLREMHPAGLWLVKSTFTTNWHNSVTKHPPPQNNNNPTTTNKQTQQQQKTLPPKKKKKKKCRETKASNQSASHRKDETRCYRAWAAFLYRSGTLGTVKLFHLCIHFVN